MGSAHLRCSKLGKGTVCGELGLDGRDGGQIGLLIQRSVAEFVKSVKLCYCEYAL